MDFDTPNGMKHIAMQMAWALLKRNDFGARRQKQFPNISNLLEKKDSL